MQTLQQDQDINCNIMIVDDSYFMRNLLRNILESIGYKVVAEAKDGYEAVEKYSKLRPHVTIMDVFMPRKDGLEAIMEIISIDKNAKVVICSTLDHEALANTALKYGAKYVIFKPYKVEDIKEVLNKVMLS
jgi:two-component system, chemotaxis family, chemotaxis protein CheY